MRQPAEVIPNPTIQKTKETLDAALRTHKVLLLVGRCAVIYEGRARSQLTPGERVVIIKEDGALLVHRPKGYEPVNWMPGRDVIYHVEIVDTKKEKTLNRLLQKENWQPPGCIFQTSVDEDVLQIKAIRKKPSESVRLFFDRILLVSAMSLVDAGTFSLYASEEDMQRAILVEPSLLEPDFKPITYEKKVEPGFIDVYGIDRNGRFVVVEIKRKTAGRQAALQLAKYVDSIRDTVNREVRGILVAPNLGKGVQRLLETLKLEYKALSPKKCAEILTRPKTKKLADFFREDEENL